MKTELESGEVTRLLDAWRLGDEDAAEELMPLIFDELRRLANGFLGKERPGHTLEPTALVHEAYLKLVEQRAKGWKNRGHFFALAARMMRRILVDYARSRLTTKRGGGEHNVSLDTVGEVAHERPDELLALDDALDALASFDPQKARLVELRYFVGLGLPQTAEALGCSTATVSREWLSARTWLYREIGMDETH